MIRGEVSHTPSKSYGNRNSKDTGLFPESMFSMAPDDERICKGRILRLVNWLRRSVLLALAGQVAPG